LTETPAHRNTGFDRGTAFQPLADFLPAGRQSRGDQARPLWQCQLATGTGAVFLGSRAKTEALGTLQPASEFFGWIQGVAEKSQREAAGVSRRAVSGRARHSIRAAAVQGRRRREESLTEKLKH
jgi:hypothetical protein